jgi:hypothetical protein
MPGFGFAQAFTVATVFSLTFFEADFPRALAARDLIWFGQQYFYCTVMSIFVQVFLIGISYRRYVRKRRGLGCARSRARRPVEAGPRLARAGAHISGLTDPQGLKALVKCPCSRTLPFQHSWCSWAKASKPIIIKAARTSPATRFFIMATTPPG